MLGLEIPSAAWVVQVAYRSVFPSIYIQYSPGSVESVYSRSRIPQLEVSLYGAKPLLLKSTGCLLMCGISHTCLCWGKTHNHLLIHTLLKDHTHRCLSMVSPILGFCRPFWFSHRNRLEISGHLIIFFSLSCWGQQISFMLVHSGNLKPPTASFRRQMHWWAVLNKTHKD